MPWVAYVSRFLLASLLAFPGPSDIVEPPFIVGGDPRVDPADFRVTVFAIGLNFPYGMQQLEDGSLLVGTSRPTSSDTPRFFASTGELVRLVDADGDGVADGAGAVLYAGLPGVVTSVRLAGNLVLVASAQPGSQRISILRRGAAAEEPFSFAGSLDLAFPSDWVHTCYALAVRPTEDRESTYEVFFNVGSRRNEKRTSDSIALGGLLGGAVLGESIYRFEVRDTGESVEASKLTLVATGLRNAAGIALHPGTGDLYFSDNGIDGLVDDNEPTSADEINRITIADVGGKVFDFGFSDDYIEYRTGLRVGSGATPPIAVFQPIDGSESEGPAEIAFAPPYFPPGLDNGIFIAFHGRSGAAGTDNEENPVVYYDLETGEYFHFVGNDEASLGHVDSLFATKDALFLADLSRTGRLDSLGAGVIYKIEARAPALRRNLPDGDRVIPASTREP